MKSIYTLLLSFLALSAISAQIVITEISYNPPEAGTDSLEYIELFNAGNADFDLSGASFVGIEYVFTNEVIQAGTYICVAVNAAAMQSVFGKTCIQWTSGGLRNGGELIQLNDGNGAELDAVEFGNVAPWPSSSDGTNGNGASIVLCDVNSDNSDPANWSAAKNNIGYQIDGKEVKGSPAADNAISCQVTPDFTIEALPSNAFAPKDITINPGQTIRWINKGGQHNVNGEQATFPNNPTSFGNGIASTDAWTYDFTFFNEGVYQYQCDPHAGLGMKGTITVGVPKVYPIYPIGLITTENATGEADSVGTTCTISGTVHGVNISTSSGLLFWLIDQNHDGISIYNNNNTLGYTVNEGDNITIKGEVSQYNGLTQFNVESIVLDGTGTLQSPITIDSMQESNESKLVKLENMTFVDASQWKGDGTSFNIDVTNGNYVASMRVSEFTDLANQATPTPPFNLVGLVNQFDSSQPYLDSYQLMPRSAADVMMISATTENELSNISIYPNPNNGHITITGISNPDEVCLYAADGKLLQTWNNPNTSMNLNQNPGLYFVSITKGNSKMYKKVIIAK